ncbi:MBL fold metallo-hydrolase [Paraliomyxa miuraensis]|uniref:MBL fold metallo-hydrolase n=1 Tax=Paraliomyxa miuraensis TaxID=376150 RepID=UPI0022565A0B|nr:MBL fold metallo-hydrolase [Paraliomyxa miuraensis]MCX4242331.1 MBL fold metallo-hydrolase [Paraliomyxa miuraensis]
MPLRERYSRGLHEIADGVWAWLQPDGSWGLSNAGLVVDGEASMLVDTLFDVPLTQAMLDAMRRATRAADALDVVVNTHANGDHCWGNQLCEGSRIVASRRAAQEMLRLDPKLVAKLAKVSQLGVRTGALGRRLGALLSRVGVRKLGAVLEGSDLLARAFGRFDFGSVRLTPPTETFDEHLQLRVGDTAVDLHEVGPAHTTSDVIVHVDSRGVVFTGDILFVDAHPIVWEGPVSNWIAACDRILEANATVIVPGHGPLAEASDVRRTQTYLRYLYDEAKARHAAGMSATEAARDISLQDFRDWREAERVVVNVRSIYRELSGGGPAGDEVVELFALMAAHAREHAG